MRPGTFAPDVLVPGHSGVQRGHLQHKIRAPSERPQRHELQRAQDGDANHGERAALRVWKDDRNALRKHRDAWGALFSLRKYIPQRESDPREHRCALAVRVSGLGAKKTHLQGGVSTTDVLRVFLAPTEEGLLGDAHGLEKDSAQRRLPGLGGRLRLEGRADPLGPAAAGAEGRRGCPRGC